MHVPLRGGKLPMMVITIETIFFYKIALTKVNITSIAITVMEFRKNKHLVSVSGNNTTYPQNMVGYWNQI